jgi:autoinducer 2-binding periplasmic protein LuxP
MRMQDDWGVALAEIIKYDLEGRIDEVPLGVSGEMQLVDETFSREDIDAILEYAFRYSGDLEVYR